VSSLAQRKSSEEVQSCEVSGCKAEAARAINAKKASGAGLSISKKMGNVHVCKEHYREFKKATKKDRELERLGW